MRAIATALFVVGMVLFAGWVFTGDFIFGHFDGWPWLLSSACGFCLAGMTMMLTVAVAARRPSASAAPATSFSGRWLQVVGWLLWIPAVLILAAGVAEWPELKAQQKRQQVADHLIDPVGPVAVPELISALEDPDYTVRYQAAEALGLLGPDAKAAVPALIRVVQNDPGNPAVSAIGALLDIGAHARPAIPALEALAEDSRRSKTERELAGLVAGQLNQLSDPPDAEAGEIEQPIDAGLR
ncbi:MAG TPA: hypothetical protein DCY13_22870 [Verrucomicrobiales bacterium]|nr:hypothetical protein [Verrucomicrobiales bacterium]